MRNGLRAFMAVVLGLSVLVTVPALAQDPVQEVGVGSNFFAPEAVTVQAGDTIRWNWTGGFHSVTSDDGLFDSGAQATDGATPFDFTFAEPGTYEYFCNIHSSANGSSQNGVITVTGPGDTPTAIPTDQPLPEPGDPDADPADVDGTDPVATALSWSGLLPDGGARNAFLGTAGGFADSLASGTGQGLLNAPLLLTDGEALDRRVVAELDRLGVTRVIILGGTAAISQGVQDELAGLVTTVDRAGGASRLETARAVADLVAPDATTVIMARAFGEGSAAFADSLGAGALGATDGWPVVLVGDTVDDGLATWLAGRGVQTIYLIGGTAAVPMEVEDSLRSNYEVIRVAGASRTATAALLLGIGSGGDTSTIVEGFGDLAWASGFAAALHATDGIVLSNAGGPALPGDTIKALLADGRFVRCGPTLDANTCGQARTASAVAGASLTAVMDLAQEPAAAGTGASGVVSVHRVRGEGGICTVATTSGLSGPITAAHIHAGGFGVAGDVVVPLSYSGADGTAAQYGCTGPDDAPLAAVDGVYADPQAHYLNIHTEMNPAGEIRGQLFADGDVPTADLTGQAEVPGPGDPAASGSARVYDTGVADELCYAVTYSGLDPAPTAAHIHLGADDEAGGVVHPLVLGSGASSYRCDRGVDPVLRADIFANPDSYYVNVHNADFAAGAIRGQLGIAITG